MPGGLHVSTSLLSVVAGDLHDSHNVDHVSSPSNCQGTTCSHGEVWESGPCGCHVSIFFIGETCHSFFYFNRFERVEFECHMSVID